MYAIIHCMPCSSQIICTMLDEIHTMEKCYFLKPISHSQTIYGKFIVFHGIVTVGMELCKHKHCFETVNATISSPLHQLSSMHTEHMASQGVF